ncbi:NAD(P)-dependent alcohol dehydrogenase [Flavilitoribacter nigricans DSM 23189 = NBRC 102662]|uniref:NAD(P)-dependent alcohol dehydrogenase n=2 Tax=Flavilitoribacter TaxID=2762562 RepID=A0A2D0NJU9_FLAN2|nr:NAD(P)-dependent alcohol dehydrogenase [Flavilitoribacter nigricans DSM 23189 = NBRC 102662]
MQAIVLTKYGSPSNLQLQEVAVPTPKENEILIRVIASTVTKADTMMRRADPFISRFFLGFFKPKNPVTGTGFAGKVVATGTGVTHFAIGDEVFGETGVQFGANAEYISLAEDAVVLKKPAGIPFEEAATITDGPLTSINFLKNLAKLQPGQKVLINGASGSLGTAAVQIAKHYGAVVTGVASGRNAELVRSLGADHFIDYTTTDFTQAGRTYDVIYDTIGNRTFSETKGVLAPTGSYISPVMGFRLFIDMLLTSRGDGKKAKFSATGLLSADELKPLIAELLQIFEAGHLRSVVDKRYTLADAPEAHRYVDTGHKRGNVVLMLAPKMAG